MKTVTKTPLAAVLALMMAGCQNPQITSPDTATGRVGEPFNYQITATRNPASFSATVPPPAGLNVDPNAGSISGTPQEDGAFRVTLSARNAAGEGTKRLSLTVSPSATPPVPSHKVVSEKELFIVAPAVLDARQAQPGGAWHIRSALQRIAGPGQDVESFAQAWFVTWANNRSLPEVDDTFAPRPWVTAKLRSAWQNDRIRLIAIVNRMDLARFPDGDMTRPPTSIGEGRFIYEVRDDNNARLPFTLIFEYGLPFEGTPNLSLTNWARRWHALGRTELGSSNQFSANYLTELQAITDKFSAHGTLNQIRANEFLDAPAGATQEWELREFHFAQNPVRLVQVPVKITPAIEHDNQPALANFIRAKEADILEGRAIDFLRELKGAIAPVPFGFSWRAPDAPARATFITSFNTCSGCHAGDTRTPFQHIGVRAPQMSDFLTKSIELREALPRKESRMHNEMEERRTLLADFAGDVPSFVTTAFKTENVSRLIKARANRPH